MKSLNRIGLLVGAFCALFVFGCEESSPTKSDGQNSLVGTWRHEKIKEIEDGLVEWFDADEIGETGTIILQSDSTYHRQSCYSPDLDPAYIECQDDLGTWYATTDTLTLVSEYDSPQKRPYRFEGDHLVFSSNDGPECKIYHYYARQ